MSISKNPHHFDGQSPRVSDKTAEIKLQTDLVQAIWQNLTEPERKIYEQIIDDSRNQLIMNIILVAASVGMKLQYDHLQNKINEIELINKKTVEINNKNRQTVMLMLTTSLVLIVTSLTLLMLMAVF